MNTSKTTWILIAIAVLIALNIWILCSFWKHQHHPMVHQPAPTVPHHAGKIPFDDISFVLNFSEAQNQQFDSIMKAHHAQIRLWKDSSRTLKKDLFLNINIANSNFTDVTHRIGAIQTKIDSLTFSTLQKIYGMANSNQQAKLMDLLHDFFSKKGSEPNMQGNHPAPNQPPHPPHAHGEMPPPEANPED